MKHGSLRQLLVLVLGVFLVLGTVTSAVQAGEMADVMADQSEADSNAQGCCGGDGKGDAMAGGCTPACGAFAHALLPSVTGVATGEAMPRFAMARSPSDGRASSPDPFPPRSFDIG